MVRVPADPHLRVDTNDYSLDPALVGRRVEVRVSQREITAGLRWTPASSRADTSGASPSTAPSPRSSTPARFARSAAASQSSGLDVEVRPLAAYDPLIA